MPSAAFVERKYLRGTADSSTSVSDGWEEGEDKHPTSSLRNPVLGIDNPPCKVHCPAPGQFVAHMSEVSTTVGVEESGDVFQENCCWSPTICGITHLHDQTDDLVEQPASLAGQTFVRASP